ncbi:helix-turn-helix domain-containing protein [Curtobacterium sp. MCBD17_035]|uniref:PucR family transcriptional regulator n=1 Tax=Curtobacterium sp. MCBD17_035 TaxID=2175673 RepID=UPI0021AD4533|nr:helix-turn-helix domain-containing protein [Curtobacterium sp. MCBD17_035]WIB66928.1 helix-turn-helix domain-containing protein [Curtobacterium sp. MCBD17_035]
MIPLRELLAMLSTARSEVRLLAGPDDPGVARVLGLVGAVDVVGRELSGTAGGDGCAVVLLTPVARFDARFDVLLRRAAGVGVRTLVVRPDPAAVPDSAPMPGPGTRALADRLGVAVLATDDAWSTSVRLHELVGTGEAPAARAAVAVARIGLEAGPDLDDLFRQLDRQLGAPVRFLDAAGRPLRGPGVGAGAVRMLARAAGGSEPITVTDGDETLVLVPVGTGIGARAWLGVGLTAPVRAERTTMAVALRVAAVAVGHRLVLTRLDDERDARYRTAMLDELRAADGSPEPGLVQRTLAAGWQLDAWHVGIRVVTRHPVDQVALRGEVEVAMAAAGLEVDVVEQGDGWALWTSDLDEPDHLRIGAVATAVRRAQAALRPGLDTAVGVGSVQAGLVGLVRTLGEATDAARLAGGRPESGHFVHVDRLGLAQLLLAWTETDTFLPAAEQLLAPLERGGGALRVTLAAYLDAESSLAETAAVLGVHRNTVADRIARVERLLAVDLADPETRLALHLATRVRRE